MSNIKIIVGDEIIANLLCSKWAKEICISEVLNISSKEDLEDIISPFSLSSTLYIWKNPIKDDLSLFEELIEYIPSNKYICIITSSIDKRLSIYKKLDKNINDIGYILYSDRKKCISFIESISSFDNPTCTKIYELSFPKEIDLPNKNGNKVPTAVLNTNRIVNEIEKIKLSPNVDLAKIICRGEVYSSWAFIDAVFNENWDLATKQINYLVKDMNDLLLLLGLLISEAKLGLLVASSKNRQPQAILSKLAASRSNEYIFDDTSSNTKKSKLEVHPYRIIKMSQRVDRYFADRCKNLIQKCHKYNSLCRNDVPIKFLINAFILEIE